MGVKCISVHSYVEMDSQKGFIQYTCNDKRFLSYNFKFALLQNIRSRTTPQKQIHALRVQVAENRDMANAARLRKTAVSTFYLYAVFLACYVPVFCLFFSSFIGGLTAVPFGMWYYVFTLMYPNSSVNPLIYN